MYRVGNCYKTCVSIHPHVSIQLQLPLPEERRHPRVGSCSHLPPYSCAWPRQWWHWWEWRREGAHAGAARELPTSMEIIWHSTNFSGNRSSSTGAAISCNRLVLDSTARGEGAGRAGFSFGKARWHCHGGCVPWECSSSPSVPSEHRAGCSKPFSVLTQVLKAPRQPGMRSHQGPSLVSPSH